MKKKISFIINPISGGIKKDKFPALIGKHIDCNRFDVEINFTRSADDNLYLADEAVKSKKDIIVAVGGDGTINNVAKYVAGSDSVLGIIPQGSGNGLARHLQIPMDNEKALRIINQLNETTIDAGTANDNFFVNVAGAGFDAHVSWMFANAPKRGFWSYTKITLSEFARYRPQNYELVVDGKSVAKDAFIVCVANGSQYGNNAYIAPQAILSDGLFDISVLKPFKVLQMPFIGAEMFMKKFSNSKYIDTFKGRDIVLKREHEGVFNIDGEPVIMEKDIHIRMLPASLRVIVPVKAYNK